MVTEQSASPDKGHDVAESSETFPVSGPCDLLLSLRLLMHLQAPESTDNQNKLQQTRLKVNALDYNANISMLTSSQLQC